jgi:hypothetical protein
MTWIIRDDDGEYGRSYLMSWTADHMGTEATWTTLQVKAKRFDHPEVARLTSMLNGGKVQRLVKRAKVAA